ncbi:MAG TPA: 2Fe-2S iron-sulfur cluster-binding protein [Steroidobacteraceae bacterium]|nr:2Fe-2S iron-sulfur cluster-binding protein [Steroidobacteraceae bacterium]
MTSSRLAVPCGSRIDRSQRLSFEFNGRRLIGHPGDTLASALLANGVQLVGRSFKLHRPRGIFSCGVEEPTGLVDLSEGATRTPNMRSTLVDLHEGLVAASVNCWPSVRFDLGAVNNRMAALLPAGFYYKTFKWPDWHLYEPSIRRMAGLGRASGEPDPDRYEEAAAQADVLVIGGGLAGLSAAVAAAEAGADTLLLASGSALGGALAWRDDSQIAALIVRAERCGVRQMTRTLAFGVYDHNLVCARESRSPAPTRIATGSIATGSIATGSSGGVLRERLWKIRARAVIAATGAIERPMIFPDNDRPGVMLAGAADKYAHAFGVACGQRVVIAANSDSAYRVAASLRAAGVNVVALVDRRPPADISTDAGHVRTFVSAAIARVGGTKAVRNCTVISTEMDGARPEKLDCDLILSAGGFAPAVHLHSQAGGKLRWVEESAMFVPDGAAPGLLSAGACAGIFARDAAVNHAAELGRAVARRGAAPAAPIGGAGRSLAATHAPGVIGKQFVDLQNDVAVGDIGLAAQENYRSVEHLKRYTTTGMGTDQGKTSNINALVLMGEFTGREPAGVGTTKFRPPFAPVTLGLLAGRRVGALYRPLKRLPAHGWHEARGALFEQFGNWLRPAAYPQAHESLESAAQREAGAVRRHAGVLDGSPLGKLEIYGPDAAHFLDLMYVGTMSNLSPGQARYGLLLNENGTVVDDGIVARLGPQQYWVNTTSAGVERTAAAFEEWLQCEYTHLRVLVTPVTSRWGNVTVAGPRAWDWLASVGMDPGLAPQSMKHMTLRESAWEGAPLRVLRASFSGELGYELNIPADHVKELLERLWQRAADFQAVPYGIEALEIMRTEKGYIHIGTDTDGTTLPQDVGFARAIERKAANFVGRRSLLRPAARDPGRFQLVGLAPADGRTRLPVGAQIAPGAPPTRTEGHVTSSYWSPELKRPVALGMLARGTQRVGEKIRIHHLGSVIDAVVVSSPFIDPQGDRLRG